MALRQLTATDLARGRTRAQTRDQTGARPIPAPEGGPELRLRKRPLFALCLGGPLLLALAGFVGTGARAPAWPALLAEPTQRGAILAADGTVLAEGDAGGRSYPQGRLAAQLIGFSGARQPDGVYGLEGLERKLETQLQAGEDVTLTLDPALQGIAQTELARAARLHGAKNGAVVMLEAGTGRILASASYPEFDPNMQTTLSDRSVIGNSPFTALVEPGSVMKPFVVAALMQAGKLRANEILDVPSWRQVGDKTFTDVTAHEPRLTVRDILRVSSNVGMIELGERFTSPQLAAWYRRFGFGRSVEVAFAANEEGTINPPETWVPQDHASATIGQSLSATALQLAAAYSIFANDGRYVTPQIVESALEPGAAKQVLEPAIAREVREMLAYTIENSSLSAANIPGVAVAGKSGSADLFDLEKGEYIDAGTLSFAGIFPAETPKVIGVMYLQRVREKGALSVSVTAPAFRAIGSQTVALWDEAAPGHR
jgi:cell division protein FtsI (penicillin-binding protein 3)